PRTAAKAVSEKLGNLTERVNSPTPRSDSPAPPIGRPTSAPTLRKRYQEGVVPHTPVPRVIPCLLPSHACDAGCSASSPPSWPSSSSPPGSPSGPCGAPSPTSPG